MNEASTETVNRLKDVFLKQADEQKQNAMANAQAKANEWFEQQTEKLERKCELIINEAQKRASEAYRRQIANTQHKMSGKKLHLQNNFVVKAVHDLEDKLAASRSQEERYIDTLCGMVLSAAETLRTDALRVEIANEDEKIATKLSARLSVVAPQLKVEIKYAAISGGIIAYDETGRRRVCSDWHTVASDMTEEIAEKLFVI